MKNILLILAIAFSSASFAQGNLQFNQVVNEEFTGSYNGYFNSGNITVPAGKVWKIESASLVMMDANPGIGQPLSTSSLSLVVGKYICVYTNVPEFARFPIWLSEGTYAVGGYASGPITYSANLSAIEFNVVP